MAIHYFAPGGVSRTRQPIEKRDFFDDDLDLEDEDEDGDEDEDDEDN